MKPYYYIYNAGNNPPSVKHDTLESAQAEAERLATKHPGKSFEIIKCIGISQVSQVTTTWSDGEEPKQDEPKYRYLVDGEDIKKGDQYRKEGQWVTHYQDFSKGSNVYQDPENDSYSWPHLPHRRPL